MTKRGGLYPPLSILITMETYKDVIRHLNSRIVFNSDRFDIGIPDVDPNQHHWIRRFKDTDTFVLASNIMLHFTAKWFQPTHKNFLRIRTLSNLLTVFGFEVVAQPIDFSRHLPKLCFAYIWDSSHVVYQIHRPLHKDRVSSMLVLNFMHWTATYVDLHRYKSELVPKNIQHGMIKRGIREDLRQGVKLITMNGIPTINRSPIWKSP